MSQSKTSRRNAIAVKVGSPAAKRSRTSERLPFIFSHYSIACERHPLRNEDSLITLEQSGLVGVFDGVGGSAAGEIASQTAVRAIRQGWWQALQQIHNSTGFKGRNVQSSLEDCGKVDLCELLQKLVAEADELVRTEGAQRAGTDDLATTVALAALCSAGPTDSSDQENEDTSGPKDTYTMVYAHVGDSRIYLLREHEFLQRLTIDDGLLGRLVENQMVKEEDARHIDQAMHIDQLTDVEFSYFRLRGGITQALGGPLPPTIHADSISIYPGDRILLCTDGIHDNLTDDEIEETLREGPRTSVARLLVENALLRSRQERHITIRAKPDDISAVVITCRY